MNEKKPAATNLYPKMPAGIFIMNPASVEMRFAKPIIPYTISQPFSQPAPQIARPKHDQDGGLGIFHDRLLNGLGDL
jgi:hypothetical protein